MTFYLQRNIIRRISCGYYPMNVPHTVVWIVFMRAVRRHEYSRIRRDRDTLPVKQKCPASLCTVQYLRTGIALCPDNMILTMLLSHIQKIQRQFLFAPYYWIIAEKQKNHLHSFILLYNDNIIS